jgi:SAM-dependent methyltransferase
VDSLYQDDLAYIQAAGFGTLARGAPPEIVRRLRSAVIPIRRVLDVGCGAGPLTQALLEAGFDVTGMDPSAHLLAIARTAAPGAHFVNASIYDAEIPACDAIIAVGEPLTYHPDGADSDLRISRFLRRASAILPVGGVLIFDLIECGGAPLTSRTWSSGDDWAVLVDTAEFPASQTLVRDIETFRRVGELYRRGREVHRVRLFDTRAVCAELDACGFETATARAYGTQMLAPRRRTFFAILTGRG